jgi:predicted metalloprotease with PDZ domain
MQKTERAGVIEPNDPPNLGILSLEVTPRATILCKQLCKYGSGFKAGMKDGDELVGINGKRFPKENPVKYCGELLAKAGFGGTVKVHVLRGTERVELDVTIRKRKVLALDLEEVSDILERKIAP